MTTLRFQMETIRRMAWAAALCVSCICVSCIFAAATNAQTAKLTTGHRVVSGVVLNAANGQPLEGADVTLTDAKTSAVAAEIMSDAEGHFAFPHTADGKYSLRATHRGFLASGFDEHDGFFTAIVTGEGLVTTGLQFSIKPLAVLYGTLSDDSGDPVQEGRVSLFRQDDRNGTGKIVRAGTVISDDLGNYEFPRLSPGNYYVAVMAQPWYATHPQPSGGAAPRSPLDVAYATTFYADVTDSGSATPIPVKAGDRIPVNFTLHPVPAGHLSMQVPNPERGQFMGMPQLRQDIFGSLEPAGPESVSYTRMEGNGSGMVTMELGGVAPGHYEMEMREPRGESGRFASVDVSADHQDLDSKATEALADVSGKIAMAGGGSQPSGLSIELTSQQGDQSSSARVGKDGSFEIRGLHPGTYELVPSASDAAVAPVQITASGATVDGQLLKVGNAPATVAATLVEGSSSVAGFARADGKPVPGVMVVLVPVNAAASRELFRRDQSNSDGSFTLKRVIPGNYVLVAIREGWTLDWARPEVIRHYFARGAKVTVPVHARDIQLPEALEAQLK